MRVFMVVVLALLPACFTFQAQLPGTLRALPPADVDVEVVGDVELSWVSMHYVHGVISHPEPLWFRDALLKEAKERGADAVQNIVIEGTFANIPLTVATLSMVQPRTWKMKATLVRFKPKPADQARPTADSQGDPN